MKVKGDNIHDNETEDKKGNKDDDNKSKGSPTTYFK